VDAIPKQENNQWWFIENLIAELAAPPRVKYLLTLVHRHTNARKGFAWASQKELAREMNVSVRTVERVWSAATALGVLKVRRVRTGKNPADQHNEYSLNLDRLKELQSARQHPTKMAAVQTEHPTEMSDEHPTKLASNTRQNGQEHPTKRVRTPVTSVGIGFEVKQVVSTSGREKAVSSPLGSPTAYIAPPPAPILTLAEASPIILNALNGAGRNGLNSIELAAFFGATDPDTRYKTRDRVNQILAALRKKNHRIQLIGDHPHKRYVLKT
jgi:hypothetical protein